MKTIPVVYSADDNFAMPLAVSIFSLLRNMAPDRDVQIYVVDGGITDRSKKKIAEIAQRANQKRHVRSRSDRSDSAVEIVWIQPDMKRWFGRTLKGQGNLNEMTYYRLAMPVFLPEDIDKALYVDSDIFFRGDASVVIDKITPDTAVAAVPDYLVPNWDIRLHGDQEIMQKMDVSADEPYFNAGILGVNIAWWRESNLIFHVLQYFEDYPDYVKYCDQDGLNYAVRKKWAVLDLGWNFHPTCVSKLAFSGTTIEQRVGKGFKQLQADAKAVHFTGKKPWDQGYTNPERGFFENELKQSKWFKPHEYFYWRAKWWTNLCRRVIWKKIYWKTIVFKDVLRKRSAVL